MELAKWEDEGSIKQTIPGTEAWRQASSQGEEYVTKWEKDIQVNRPAHAKKPSSRVHGPEWIN
jgi:hypothetical protein